MERLNYRERRPPADSLASANRRPVFDIDDVDTLAQGIVDTIHVPLLVLDQDLRVETPHGLPPRSNERDSRQSQIAENSLFGDESLLPGRRLCEIAHSAALPADRRQRSRR
jgi:hypothetical protein